MPPVRNPGAGEGAGIFWRVPTRDAAGCGYHPPLPWYGRKRAIL